MTLRVAVLGYGAIARPVVDALAAGQIAGAELAGVIVRRPGAASDRQLTLQQATAASDLVVECASVEAVRLHGVEVIASGTDLLVTSVGAIADASLRHALIDGGPGRTRLTAGAIGGLDLLGAAARDGGLSRLSLTSTKKATSLIQPWMAAAFAERLRTASGPVTVFDGSVQDAIVQFPKSLNVAVALAVATGMWDEVTVRLVGDPDAPHTRHEIAASGTSGEYTLSIANHPLEANPASSAVVASAVLRGIAAIARPSGSFV